MVTDDFEVSIFLTETSTRHSLLTKHKHFHDTAQTKLTSNSGRLVGATNEAPIDVDLDAAAAPITLRREDSDDDDAPAAGLAEIPLAPAAATEEEGTAAKRRPKRARRNTTDSLENAGEDEREHDTADDDFEVITSDDDGADSPGDDSDSMMPPPPKRRKEVLIAEDSSDDKKKLAMDISYEGFAIYGRVLCLVVKRRDPLHAVAGGARSGGVASGAGGKNRARQDGPGGQAMMESFIISTQMPPGDDAP